MTQQNAAESEQLAATAEEMRAQSESLKNIISFFSLDSSEKSNSGETLDKPCAIKVAVRVNNDVDSDSPVDEALFQPF